MTSFIERVKATEGHLVFLSRGAFEGKPTWHYIKVDPRKLDAFKKQVKTGSIELTEFGNILYSGWGMDPPQAIIDKVKAQFGED
jgi:hypothetical protein